MRIIVLSLLVALPGLVSGQSASKPEKDFNKLSWLEGTWTRTNAKPGRSGTERWTRAEGNILMGWGVSMKGTDTSFVEKLKIVIKSGDIYYVSDVPENPKPVDFKLTFVDGNSFVCENPAHDFPKKIAYYRDGNNLRAVISGDGKEIEYLFRRE
jgi:hypothetical protein